MAAWIGLADGTSLATKVFAATGFKRFQAINGEARGANHEKFMPTTSAVPRCGSRGSQPVSLFQE